MVLRLSIYTRTGRLATLALLAFIAGSLFSGIMWNVGGVYVPTSENLGQIYQFNSKKELINFLKENNEYIHPPFIESNDIVFSIVGKGRSEATQDFSQTNIQVEGVDEGDIVKTDGTYIYVGSNKTIFIVRAYPPEKAKIISKIEISEKIGDIYIYQNKIAVFSFKSRDIYPVMIERFYLPYSDNTTLQIFDISDIEEPKLDRELTVDGGYFNSRMIGDHIYFILKEPARILEDDVKLPCINEGDNRYKVSAESVYYFNSSDNQHIFSSIVSVNILRPEEEFQVETFLTGSRSCLYASTSNIYITSSGIYGTSIHKISIKEGEIKFHSQGTIPGYVLNQFSLDEYKGYLRIATTKENHGTRSKRVNNVYILNETLGVIGRLENLAPGENIYSARFMKDRCYLVTFKKVDPLFALDLSDPEDPKILGKLKIPGFSNYLHPYDENHVIGLGKETVEAEQGDFAWHQGIKVSLFDISDVSNPIELSKIVIGDRGSHSQALSDHHAFLFSKERQLLVIPILEAKVDPDDYAGQPEPNMYGEFTYQGAYIFDISLNGIRLRRRITHLDDNEEILKSGYIFESDYAIRRSLYIEETLYTISNNKIKLNDLTDLTELASIELS